MSDRLHYQSKHIIEHGPEEEFANQQEEVYDMLVMHGCGVYADNVEDVRYAESFYVTREDLAHMLEIMKDHDNGHIEFQSDDGVNKWPVEDVVTFFQAAYDNSDTNDQFVYFDWY